MIRRTEEKPAGVPEWIVTYSDMITLLLTFFVLLLSLGEMQDAGLVGRGRDSFVKALRGCGLGIMFGQEITPGFQHNRSRYETTTDEPNVPRTVDADREVRRRLLERISQTMTVLPSQITADRTDFAAVAVTFGPGSSVLSDASRRALERFGLELLAGTPRGTLYVLGLAPDAQSAADAWRVSAQRAEAVAAFLQAQLSPRSGFSVPPGGPVDGWHVYSWGAGASGVWAGSDRVGAMTGNNQVLIAVLKSAR